jgi:hypothetical protein
MSRGPWAPRIETASDTRSALEVLKRFKPRIILMDLQHEGAITV